MRLRARRHQHARPKVIVYAPSPSSGRNGTEAAPALLAAVIIASDTFIGARKHAARRHRCRHHRVTEAPYGRQTIAGQCCTRAGEEHGRGDSQACRRWVILGGCVVGQSSSSPPYIEALTYGEAVQRCEKHGLELCKASCLGTGCFYNMHPVYTSLPC